MIGSDEHVISEEELIHSELVAVYLETSEEGYVDMSVWTRVNELLRQLSSKSPRYLSYLLNSENIGKTIPVMRFKQLLRSAIQVLSVQEKFEDLSEIVRRNHIKSGMTFQNTATANPTQTNHQEVKIDVALRVDLVVKEIEDNLTDEQLASLRPLMKEYKNKPTRNATERLISGILGLGKDVAIGILSNIVSRQLGY